MFVGIFWKIGSAHIECGFISTLTGPNIMGEFGRTIGQ